MVSPLSKLSDWERILWSNVPKEFNGRIISLDELKDLFSQGENGSEVYPFKEEDTHIIYGRETPSGMIEYLAYQCKSCNTLMIGSPEIRDNNSLKRGIPLTGKDGYDRICRNCHAYLGEVHLEVR